MYRQVSSWAGLASSLALLSAGPPQLHAQADGTYCAGPSYVAYERAWPATYDSVHGPRPAVHTLHILRLDSVGSVASHQQLALPPFTVHGMQCATAEVRLLGWDSVYATSLGHRVLRAELAPWAGKGSSRAPLPEYPDSTLWHGWDVKAVHRIALPQLAGRYPFRLTVVAREVSRPKCLYRVITRLEAVGPGQVARRSTELYRAVLHGECGE